MASILKERSYSFAVDIVNVYRKMVSDKKEFVLSKQLRRSGTATGALIAESAYAQSRPDFISKLSISLKEAHETRYWLCLLKDTCYLDEDTSAVLQPKVDELLRLLTASIKTAKGIEKTNG